MTIISKTTQGGYMKKVILFLYVLTFCSMYQASAFDFSFAKPSATMKEFDIESITLRDVTFLFNVSVKNPYPVGLTLAGVKLKFSVEGKQLFETETSKGFKIKARGEADNKFTVNLKYVDIIKIIKDYSQKEYLETTINTEIIVPTPKAVRKPPIPESFSFKYTLHKKIPAIKPTINIANFSVQEPSLEDVTTALKKAGKNVDPKKAANMISNLISGKKADNIIDPASIDLKLKVNFDIELKNDSKAKLLFSSLDYNFFVNSATLVNGNTTKISSKGDKQVLTVANEFSTRSLAGPILAAFKKRQGAFTVKGNTHIKLPDEIKKDPVKLTFSEGGAFELK
jgi:LEA14-like dessication related protein